MSPADYTTVDYMEELERVRKARRRNAAIIIVADLAVIAGVAYVFLSGVIH